MVLATGLSPQHLRRLARLPESHQDRIPGAFIPKGRKHVKYMPGRALNGWIEARRRWSMARAFRRGGRAALANLLLNWNGYALLSASDNAKCFPSAYKFSRKRRAERDAAIKRYDLLSANARLGPEGQREIEKFSRTGDVPDKTAVLNVAVDLVEYSKSIPHHLLERGTAAPTWQEVFSGHRDLVQVLVGINQAGGLVELLRVGAAVVAADLIGWQIFNRETTLRYRLPNQKTHIAAQ